MGANIIEFNVVVLLVVGDVIVNSEMHVTTSSISSRGFTGPVFKGVHRGRVCVHAFIKDDCAYIINVYVIPCNLKKE